MVAQALEKSNDELEKTLTELRETQDQLIRQERLRALGTMASGVAHDFNNALVPITGFTDMLLTYPDILEDREKTIGYLEGVNTAAKDAGQVVSRMRDFYRHRDNTDVLEPVDMNLIVEQAVSMTQPKWMDMTMARGIEIKLETKLDSLVKTRFEEVPAL